MPSPVMREFGPYRTDSEEPLKRREESGHISEVWRATRADTTDGRHYAIKVYHPRSRSGRPAVDDELAADPCLDFLEGVKRLKKAKQDGGRCLANVYEFGRTDGGAWYAMDWSERGSLEDSIARQLATNSAGLRHVVSSLVTGCLALQRSSGRSHGGLSASNVLLAGGGPALNKTRLEITDPYPASMRVINQLGDADRREVTELLEQVIEKQDLRCIGEIILQLVERRQVRNAYDYNYPIRVSGFWTGLGKDHGWWLELCNKLLDPDLSAGTVSLESLAAEFGSQGPSLPKLPKLPPKVLIGVGAAVVAVALLVGGVALVKGLLPSDQERYGKAMETARQALGGNDFKLAREQVSIALELSPAQSEDARNLLKDVELQESAYVNRIYEGAVNAADQAFKSQQWQVASDKAAEALRLKPNDPRATQLQTDARARLDGEQNYGAAVAAADTALRAGRWQEALDKATEALTYKPSDPRATQIKDDAGSRLSSDQKYGGAIAAADTAFRSGRWQEALDKATEALGYKANDPKATQIKSDARARLEGEQKYGAAIAAADAALTNGRWQEALDRATEALTHRPNDPRATQIRNDAGSKLSSDQKYGAAIAAADAAFKSARWQEALDKSTEALTYKPNDPRATQLKTDAQARLVGEQTYGAAVAAADTALQNGRWQEALDKASEALTYKPNNPRATQLKTDAQARLEGEQKYGAAIAAADAAFKNSRWQEALEKATEALTYKANDPRATQIKTDAEARLGVEQKYGAAIAAADTAFRSGRWQEALDKATEALTHKANDQKATQIKSDAQARIDGDQKYGAAIAAADAAFKSSRWQEALDKATEALTYQANDRRATQIKTDAQARLDGERKYGTAIAAADAAFRNRQWQEAIDKATEALSQKPDDPRATQRKAEAQAGLKAEVDGQLQAANTAFQAGQYAAALSLCDRYLADKRFDELKRKVEAENSVLKEAQSTFSAGAGNASHYMQIERGLSGLKSKSAVSDFLARVAVEKATYERLAQLTNSAKWAQLNSELGTLASSDPAAANKIQFKELQTWRDQHNPKNELLNVITVLKLVTGIQSDNPNGLQDPYLKRDARRVSATEFSSYGPSYLQWLDLVEDQLKTQYPEDYKKLQEDIDRVRTILKRF